MSTKIRWTHAEWHKVIKGVHEVVTEGDTFGSIANAANTSQCIYLDRSRWRPMKSLYNVADEISKRYEVFLASIEPIEKVSQDISIESSQESIIRAIVREELERVFSMYFIPRTSSVNPVKAFDIGLINPESTRKLKVDVIGLIGPQIEQVKNNVDHLSLRFIAVDDKISSLADNVVICTKFVSHKVQEKVKSNGSKIHYANGGAASVLQVLGALK